MTTEEIQDILNSLEKRLTEIFMNNNTCLIEAFDICPYSQKIWAILNDYSYNCIPKVYKLREDMDALNSEYGDKLKQITSQLKTSIKIIIYGSAGHALDSVDVVIKGRVI